MEGRKKGESGQPGKLSLNPDSAIYFLGDLKPVDVTFFELHSSHLLNIGPNTFTEGLFQRLKEVLGLDVVLQLLTQSRYSVQAGCLPSSLAKENWILRQRPGPPFIEPGEWDRLDPQCAGQVCTGW